MSYAPYRKRNDSIPLKSIYPISSGDVSIGDASSGDVLVTPEGEDYAALILHKGTLDDTSHQ